MSYISSIGVIRFDLLLTVIYLHIHYYLGQWLTVVTCILDLLEPNLTE